MSKINFNQYKNVFEYTSNDGRYATHGDSSLRPVALKIHKAINRFILPEPYCVKVSLHHDKCGVWFWLYIFNPENPKEKHEFSSVLEIAPEPSPFGILTAFSDAVQDVIYKFYANSQED